MIRVVVVVVVVINVEGQESGSHRNSSVGVVLLAIIRNITTTAHTVIVALLHIPYRIQL